jgi:hypothetical protein
MKRPMNCVTKNIDRRSRVIVNLCFTLLPRWVRVERYLRILGSKI